MTSPMPAGVPELLVVGGLTIDQLLDGRRVAGGSVLHAARAMALDGRRVEVRALAGPEPEVRAGLDELRSLADLTLTPVGRTTCYLHEGTSAARVLRYAGGDPASLPAEPSTAAAVLLAPIAGEIQDVAAARAAGGGVVGANLQGWLRRLALGEPVRQIPLGEIDAATRRGLGACDVLVASREDLSDVAADPPRQLTALRAAFGDHPILVVTDAGAGAWVAIGEQHHHVPVPRVVRRTTTVGAGDAFAAALLAALGRGVPTLDAASDAATLAAEYLAERAGRAVSVMGDIHGMRDQALRVLAEAKIVDGDHHWIAGRDELWLTGDLVDRGPDGVGVLDLYLRLAAEAEEQGGRVGSVLGNHELLLMAAHLAPDAKMGGPGGTALGDWLGNGGQASDLERLEDAHLKAIRRMPAMARVGSALILHADAPLYLDLGRSLSEVNAVMAGALAMPDPHRWDDLLAAFAERRAFWRDPSLVSSFLGRFGGRVLIHGHTPLSLLTGDHGQDLTRAVVYADGRCVAVDGALCTGGPGFLVRVPAA